MKDERREQPTPLKRRLPTGRTWSKRHRPPRRAPLRGRDALCTTQVLLRSPGSGFSSAHKARAVLRYSWNLSQSHLGSLRVCALSGLLEVQRGAHSCRSIPLSYVTQIPQHCEVLTGRGARIGVHMDPSCARLSLSESGLIVPTTAENLSITEITIRKVFQG